MNVARWMRWLAATAALGLAACGGGGGIGGTGAATGTMRVSMTDAPACGYDQVWVTVKSVRVHQSSSADPSAPTGWTEIPVDAPNGRRIDLLTLRNGLMTELGEATLPAGTYEQMRLVLAETGNTAPYANAVFPTGDTQERALDTPSGQQSGIKLNVNVTVPAGQEAHVLLDFDACKSIVTAGNSGKYNLKPVIGVTTLLQDAGLRVQGVVAPGLAHAATSVSVQASGPGGPVVAKSTTPAADGSFVLYPVPVGTYDLVITSPAYATAVMTGVPVASGTPTVVSKAAVPLAPALAGAAVPRTASGTLTPATGTVRALQAFQGGPTVEVQWAPVDTSGAFTFALPVAPAQRTPYVAAVDSVGTWAWTTDATTPTAYTVQATAADGVTVQTVGPFSVLANTLPALDFTFP